MSKTLWDKPGKGERFEAYRISEHFADLRSWVDDAYFNKGLEQYLDPDFPVKIRDADFYAHLWELELAEWFYLAELSMIPTRSNGPDFCIELANKDRVWIEAVLATPDAELEKLWQERMQTGEVYNTPVNEMALRYANSLFIKATKIRQRYLDRVGPEDYVLIAVSGYPGGALSPDMEYFMRAATTADNPVVHFSTDGKPLDPKVRRATHSAKAELTKANGSPVLKQFLYPGDQFPFIDGAMFSEASNLQKLIGRFAYDSDDDPAWHNVPHVFSNYSATKSLPEEFTENFYYRPFADNPPFISIETIAPTRKYD